MTERSTHNNPHGSPTDRYRPDHPLDPTTGNDELSLGSSSVRSIERAAVVGALVRLANDTKTTTRTIAVTELERLLPRAAESPELRAAVVRQIPPITNAIRVATDLGVLTDLFRLSGEIGRIGELEAHAGGEGLSVKERTAALQGLASAILSKLYEPNRALPEIVTENAVMALARFPHTIADLARPLLHSLERSHPTNTRISFGCDLIRRVDDRQSAAKTSTVKGLPSLAAFFGLHGLIGRARWGDAESSAVETLVRAFNAPPDLPPPYDPASSALRAAHERHVREAIRVLRRFGSRNKDVLEPIDSVRAAVALSTCLSSPLYDSVSIAALRSLGAAAAPALPALIEVAASRRFLNSTRGEAFEAIGHILAALPEIDCSDSRGLGGRFLETAARALHGSNPLLVQKSLQALTILGPRGAALAPSIEFALWSDLDATPSPGEDENAALQPVALYAIEALAAVDPSGTAAAKTFGRIFDASRTPDDIRHQLIVALGELAEREEIPAPIVDAITARIVAYRHLPEYLAEEALAMIQRLEHALDLHPAQMPLATIALLRSQKLDTAAKEGYLLSLIAGSEGFPQSVVGILIAAYPDIASVARLDDLALETLRHLRR